MIEKQLIEQFIDDSGDRHCFTVTPNIIINTYSAIESGVYTYIKKRAGETGEFYETQVSASKKLKISLKLYSRILKTLEKDKRIELTGTKVFRTSPVNVYKILNIWKENDRDASKKEI